MQITQKKAIRIISKSNYNSHTTPLFKNLEILPIKEQTIFNKLQIMFDFVHHRLPCSFDNLWKKNSNRTVRRLRNSHFFDVPEVRLESFKAFPFSDLPRQWNNIIIPNTNYSMDLENEQLFIFNENMSRKQFSLNLKAYLLENI